MNMNICRMASASEEVQAHRVGVGLQLDKHMKDGASQQSLPVVSKVLHGSSAHKDGRITPGDALWAINGVPVGGKSLNMGE